MNWKNESSAYRAIWRMRSKHELSSHDLEMCELALKAFPDSVRLFNAVGDCLRLADTRSPRLSPLQCYLSALALDVSNKEIWVDIGYYVDEVVDDLAAAFAAFNKAIELGGTPDAYAGLARVQAELGERDAAEDSVRRGLSLYPGDEVLCTMAQELKDGCWEPS